MADKLLSFDDGVHCLRQGGLVIYPTETFFAVGCALGAATCLERLYDAKKRPKKRPIPVLAANMEQVRNIAHLSQVEKKLAEQFWPAPLTIICEAKETVPNIVSADSGRVAVRISPHPIALALTKALGDVLVCSSANISGQPPVVDYTELSSELVQMVDGVIIDGPCPAGGFASTLVQVVGEKELLIRRQGAVPEGDLINSGWNIFK